MREHRPCVTRRALLRIGGVSGLVGLAGCRSSETGGGGTTADGNSPFRSVTVEGKHLVVRLREDADVSEVTLIKPDGSFYGQREIASGVTTVRFQLLDYEYGEPEHYSPGEYELTAVARNQSESTTVELYPELEIVDVRQYRADDQYENHGHIAVEVENAGTAPTWVYDIAYEDPPREGAKDSLGERENIFHFKKPEDNEEILLHPNDVQSYVEQTPSLRFSELDDQSCDDTLETTLLVGTAVGEPLERHLRIVLDGEPISVSAVGDFVCSDVTIEQLDDGQSIEPVSDRS